MQSAQQMMAQRAKKPEIMRGLGLFGLLLFTATITGCANTGPHTINLMPAPAVFEGGLIDPFLDNQPPFPPGDFSVLYATDRMPSDNLNERPFYLNDAGFIVRLGQARIHAGTGLDWKEARRISLSKKRSRDYPLKVLSVDETSVLDSTHTFLTQQPEANVTSDHTGEKFAALVDERLAASRVKDVYVYVHGFRVVFDTPVLIATELWHFLGYRGAFMAYAWPSTPNVFAYLSDLETAITMARKLRLFLTFLSEKTEAERIHIIGFSAGSRLVIGALNQLALLNADTSDEQIRQRLRIGNVIVVGGDISREEFGAAVADGLLRIPERTVIYVSSADRALAWSRFIFRRERLGAISEDELPARAIGFLRTHPSLQFIDVTGAAGSTFGNGHSYFRNSPWVSSDILTLLAFNLDPARRGLEKDANQLVWKFPSDYIDRLQKTLLELHPELTTNLTRDTL